MALGQANSNKFHIGNAEIRFGTLTNAMRLTSSSALGLLQSATVNFQQDTVDLEGGLPKQLIDTAITKTNVTITAQAYEYTRRNIRVMLNEGAEDIGSVNEFSGQITVSDTITDNNTATLDNVDIYKYFTSSNLNRMNGNTVPVLPAGSSIDIIAGTLGAPDGTATTSSIGLLPLNVSYSSVEVGDIIIVYKAGQPDQVSSLRIKGKIQLNSTTHSTTNLTTTTNAISNAPSSTTASALRALIASAESNLTTLIDAFTTARFTSANYTDAFALKLTEKAAAKAASDSSPSDKDLATKYANAFVVAAKAAIAMATNDGLTIVSIDLAKTPATFDIYPGDYFYKANQVGLGTQSKTNYFSASVLSMEHSTGKPIGFHFWKVAVGGGLEYGFSNDNFAVTPITFKVLAPTADDYAMGGSLYRLRDIIPTNPYGMYFAG